MRWFHKNSSCVLAPTHSMKKELIDIGFQNNIVTWTRGVDRGHLWSDTKYQHPNKTLKVLCVGRVSTEKNLPVLLKLENDFDITIVGDGPIKKSLEQKYRNVKFVGYKHGRKLAEEYAQADVFVFPSLTDTVGIVNIESMTLGTPVVAFDVTGPKDIIEQGTSGYLITNESELPDAIRQASKLDRQLVKKYSEQYTWQNSWDIFKESLVAIN